MTRFVANQEITHHTGFLEVAFMSISSIRFQRRVHGRDRDRVCTVHSAFVHIIQATHRNGRNLTR